MQTGEHDGTSPNCRTEHDDSTRRNVRHRAPTCENVALRALTGFGHELVQSLSCERDRLLVASEEALLDGIPDSLKEWDKITVDLDQATSLATNGLPLGPDSYVTDPEFSPLGQEIEKFGVHVEYVGFSITRSLGGSFRCSTQPLLRKF